jgi:uncharacterized membrane protein
MTWEGLSMRLKNLDLVIAMTIAVVNVVWALLPSRPAIIGIILALPLVFVMPGYTLVEALFHKRSLDTSHRLLLSLGLSLTIDVLGGFILNMLPIGLQAISWAVLLGLLTTVFSLWVAYLRRGGQLNRTQLVNLRITIYEYLLLVLAAIVAILSILYATIGAAHQPYPGFTQLWMLPAVQTGKSCTVHLGIRSFESTPVTYRITMTVQGIPTASWSTIALAPQEQWSRAVPISSKLTNEVHVAAQLYRLDKPETVYRNVEATLYGCPALQTTPTAYSGLNRIYNTTYSSHTSEPHNKYASYQDRP